MIWSMMKTIKKSIMKYKLISSIKLKQKDKSFLLSSKEEEEEKPMQKNKL